MQRDLPTYIANDAAPLFPDYESMSDKEFVEYESPPERLAFYQLHTEEGLEAFLYDLYWIGYPGLFIAANHVWDLLIPPRRYRCTLMGQMSGAGGAGKQALVKTLNQFVDEALATFEWDMPKVADFGDLESHHHHVMGMMFDQEAEVRKIVAKYAAILNGEKPIQHVSICGELIVGPWRQLNDIRDRRARPVETGR